MAISNAQKVALRTWFSTPGPKKTLTDASVWWQSQYGYSLSLSTASDILSARHQHLDSGDFNPKAKKGRTAEWTILEAALSDWAIRFDQAHGSVTGDLIRLKATELWIKLPLYQGLECPTWSNGWLGGFKSRFNFRRRRKAGESGSVNITEDILIQMQKLRQIKAEYQPEDIYNMDETGFLWKRLPLSGLTTSSLGLKADKTRITANLCCNETGSDKLPLWFIGKAERPRCFAQNHVYIPENRGFFWRWNSTAWMVTGIMLEWLRWFDTRAQRPVLLLMDNFSAHEAAVELLEASALPLKWTRIEWFPANTTSCFQPLDQGIIQNWKCYVRKELLRFLMVEFDAGRDYNKTHHVLRAIEWGIQAWAAVELQTISKCWQKGFQIEGPANLDQWSESLDLIQDIQSTARTIARNQGVQAPLDNIRDFIYPEVERVIDSEEDITTQIVEHYSLPEKDQDEEVGVEDIVEKVSISEAINALNTLKKYQGQRNQLANQDLMVQLQKELRSLQAERFNSQRQSDLIGWLGGRAEKGLN
jgi:hypothetical protein